MVHAEGSSTLYLYGGATQAPLNAISKLMTPGPESTQCQWQLMQPKYNCELAKLRPRTGFDGVHHKGKIFFLFGCQKYDIVKKEKSCVDDVVVYDIINNTVSIHDPEHKPERFLAGRKHYAGFMLGNIYYVHGGQDERGKVLSQFLSINLDTMIWEELIWRTPRTSTKKFKPTESVSKDGMLEGFYGHKMCVVAHKRTAMDIDYLGKRVEEACCRTFIKHEGIYMFGGITG